MNSLKGVFWLGLLSFALLPLNADFYVKVPEFEPGDGGGDYSLFKPPWYPYDIEEALKYTVDEKGKLVERKQDDGLDQYGKKKQTKAEEVKSVLKKQNEKIIFEKVLGSPRVIVLDFYGHIPFLAFDLPQGWSTGGVVLSGGTAFEFGGDPPIPGDFRLLYDSWICCMMAGWWSQTGGFYPRIWKGLLVPNLRELTVFFASQGAAIAKHSQVLLERGSSQKTFNIGLAVLKAISGEDFGTDTGKWNTQFVTKVYTDKLKRDDPDYQSWQACVRSLMREDLARKRVPAQNAFYRLRDVPELSEPVFAKAYEEDRLSLVEKRNLASLFQEFSSPKAAQLLHKLAKDSDDVTKIRAVQSLAQHPHGRVRQILKDWLKTDNDVLRAKSIILMGRSGDADLAQTLMEFEPDCKDDLERELVLRSLMRLRHAPAKGLFEKNQKSKFETLAYTSQLGLMVLGELSEGQILDIVKNAFRREDAIPASGKAVSFNPSFRFDLIRWMATSSYKSVRRKLWNYIRNYKDLGAGSEVGGNPHVLAFALSRIQLGDDIIPESEAKKVLDLMVARSETDPQIRIAALGRYYEVESKGCLKHCKKIVGRFIKGRKIPEAHPLDVTEHDVLGAMLNLMLIDDPDQTDLFVKVMTNPNFDGEMKSRLLTQIYKKKRRTALKVIQKCLKFQLSRVVDKQARSIKENKEYQYLIRLIRFAGLFQDKKIIDSLFTLIKKNKDPWIRFMSLYSLRICLDSESYENVIDGKAADRSKLIESFKEKVKELKIK